MPRQMSFESCTNVSSCVRTGRQNLLSNVKVSVSVASTTSSGCMATQSCRRNELLKSTTKLGSDPLKGSSRVKFGASHTQRGPVWNRIQKSTRNCGSWHTFEHSQQPNRACSDDTRCRYDWPLAETTLGNSPRRCH